MESQVREPRRSTRASRPVSRLELHMMGQSDVPNNMKKKKQVAFIKEKLR
jgi:hypothetical protein